MTQEIKSCYSRVSAIYPNLIAEINQRAHSESAPLNDYEDIGFSGLGNKNQSEEDKKKWAEQTKSLAEYSITSHLAETLLELTAVFFQDKDSEDGNLSKGFFVAESLFESIGYSCRNMIYGRKDDNIGAEEFASEKFGDIATKRLGKLNNILQTKLRFAVPVIGFFSPEFANDLRWLLFNSVDSSWWRNMSLNSGFYTGIMNDFGNKLKSLIGIEKRSGTDGR